MNHRWQRAFTLTELLVVIAIIALLASLILPALAQAKSKVRQTVCVNEFRQWAFALTLYLEAHEGYIPRENGGPTVNYPATVAAVTNSDAWYNALPRALEIFPASKHMRGETCLDTFYTGLFFCPSASVSSSDRNTAPRFSRGMNGALTKTRIRLNENSMRLAGARNLFSRKWTPRRAASLHPGSVRWPSAY